MSYPGRGSLHPEGHQRPEYREPRRYSDDDDEEEDDRIQPGLRTPHGGSLSPNHSGSVNTEYGNYETGTSHPSRRRTQPGVQPALNNAARPPPSMSNHDPNQRPRVSTGSGSTTYSSPNVFEAFIKIETNDLETLHRLVNRYPEVLQEDAKSLQEQAMEALLRRDSGHFDRCMHRAVLIATCKRGRFDDVEAVRFVRNLSNQGEDYNQFMSRYKQAKASLYKAREQNMPTNATYATGPTAAAQPITASLAGMNLGDSRTPYAHYSISQSRGESSGTRTSPRDNARQLDPQRRSDPHIETRLPGEEPPVHFNARGLPSRKEGAKLQITGNNTASLSAEYKVRKNPERFFIFGKVFKVLWHQPAGADTDGRVNQGSPHTNGAFNEPIYSSLRWMMVVAAKKGYCICCPISTYTNKGLKYKKLHEAEIKAHAIVYASGTRPCVLKDEPLMTKEPIRINMVGDEGLNAASRVHFGKCHTVEYNVKVMELGQVDKDHEARVAGYFVRELQGQLLQP